MDVKTLIEEFEDFLAPKLDTYEQVIYLYILRHSRLQGKAEITIGFKSARLKMAFGKSAGTQLMSQTTCYEKLQSLKSKGCLQILGTERDGTRLRLFLPSEIEGLIPPEQIAAVLSIEEMDFFNVAENRQSILDREGNQCFYCLRQLNSSNYVIEHVTSRPEGNNSYRNVVAACRNCNNRKSNTPVEDFLRCLYREGYLSEPDFEQRLKTLQRLRSGEFKPTIS